MNPLVADFDLSGSILEAGGFVLRSGKLFEAGSYLDKQFELTPDELASAAAEFKPVPVDLEHVPTILDGKLGELWNVQVAPDQRTLLGTVAVPRWLNDVLGSDPLKVSCTWDRSAKRLTRLALVRNPRVSDAVLMSAFSAVDEEPAEFDLQKAHWVTIDGHPVLLQGKQIHSGHVARAAEKHGLSPKAHEALTKAHEAGHLETHRDLYHVVSHAKQLQKGGLKEGLAVKTALEGHKARQAAQGAQEKASGPKGVSEMPAADIHADPERFQYKVMVGRSGTSGELKGVQKWNPNLGGVLLTWKDPADGKTYVVNGHHRLELAQRLGVENLAVRHLDVPDAATARYVGAVANIAEGRGTAIDAAKLLREKGVTPEQLAEDGVSLKGKLAADGMALTKLPAPLWGKVFKGEMSVSRGVAIGASGLQAHEQALLHDLAEKQEKRGKRLSDAEVSELARHIQGAGEASTQTSNLFGDEEVKQNLVVEKAQLSAWLKGQLSRDKKLFGYVAKGQRAEELQRAGNTINVSESQRIAEQSAQMEELFNRLAHRSGPIASALHRSATELAQGGKADAIRSELYGHVRDAIAASLGGAAKGGAHDAEDPSSRRAPSGPGLFSWNWPGGERPARRGEEHRPMKRTTLWDRIKHALGAAGVDGDMEVTAEFDGEGEGEGTPRRPDPAPAVVEMSAADRARFERLEQDLARERAARLQGEAAAFADSEIAAHRAFPAERGALVAAFTQAAADDLAHPAQVTFGEGKQGSRVDALKAAQAARPAYRLTEELLKPGAPTEGLVLLNKQESDDGKEKPPSDERKAELLKMTPLGEAAFAACNGK